MIHKFIIELTDDTKGYEDGVDYLERVYGAEELTDVPIIHGKEELELHDREIRNKAIDDFTEKISLEISESIIWGILADWHKNDNMNDTSDKIVDYVIETSKKIAEQLKVGGEND